MKNSPRPSVDGLFCAGPHPIPLSCAPSASLASRYNNAYSSQSKQTREPFARLKVNLPIPYNNEFDAQPKSHPLVARVLLRRIHIDSNAFRKVIKTILGSEELIAEETPRGLRYMLTE